MNLLKEFRPALIFLAKFLAIYFAGNILYGIFIESYRNKPDPVTRMVTGQTSFVLNAFSFETDFQDHATLPKIVLNHDNKRVLNIFEGCNGINVMIVFVAFLFAFGGPAKKLSLFLLLGLIIIHLFNLLRLFLLYLLAVSNSPQFYYYHKFFFTAILYLVVFGLWAIWVTRLNENRNIRTAA